MPSLERFLEKCAEARALASKMRDPQVVHHYDCDGLCAGSVSILGLRYFLGKMPRSACVRKLDDVFLQSIKHEPEIVFADLGSSTPQVDELGGQILILDHHQTVQKNHFQVNPHDFGLDGGAEVSAAGVCHLVFGAYGKPAEENAGGKRKTAAVGGVSSGLGSGFAGADGSGLVVSGSGADTFAGLEQFGAEDNRPATADLAVVGAVGDIQYPLA